MESKILVNPTTGGARTYLAEELPLSTPYLIQIFPVYACNFRCKYCIYSLEKANHGYISDEIFMSIDLFKKIIDDIKKFDKKIKMIRFAAIGEPLLHNKISEMIKYVREADVAESIDIVTNASMLNEELSLKLINSGLSKLRISIEGLSSEEYLENCGAKIDFDNLVKQISYFYQNKKETKVYIKIIDYMIKTDKNKDDFYEIFAPICDEIAIEHLTPTIAEIDYEIISNGAEMNKPQNEEDMIFTQICPQPFYMMQVNPDGNVVPCCAMKYPAVIDNVKNNSVTDIWNSSSYNEFRIKLLSGVTMAGEVCRNCNLYLYGMHREDVLDEYASLLKSKYMEEI